MEADFRVSVRELVAFTYRPEDILPATNMRALWAGTLAHQARQKQQSGQAERSIKHVFELAQTSVHVYGRMDAFTEGDTPFVEEIKLSEWASDGPLPEHRAQALCYAAMVALNKPCEAVRFTVSYVNEAGQILKDFPETLSVPALLAQMELLLVPYVAYEVRERAHRQARDESLKALAFPFDRYRAGQRELAVQVYTAILRKKRLFASLPTGTGKSAAVLFPALKALGEQKTGKLVYLTARNTARQSPMNALERMWRSGMRLRGVTLTAKEKLCPHPTRCHPDYCPRAKGHYLRQDAAVDELLKLEPLCWTDEIILDSAQRHQLCPFELALSLTELADVVMMDLNYAFDPFAQLKRLFLQRRDITLLVDEAHHTVERVRESLSGELDSGGLARMRTAFGKEFGRKHPYYLALGGMIQSLRALGIRRTLEPGLEKESPSGAEQPAQERRANPSRESEQAEESLEELPEDVPFKARHLLEEALSLFSKPMPSAEIMADAAAVARLCFPFLYAVEHLDEDYAILLRVHGRERALTLYCLLPAKEIARITKPLRGTVFFSATLSPLPAMKRLLGGVEDDACFSLPSPFQRERLAVVRRRISTRYTEREQSVERVAQSIMEAVNSREGKYIAYFPSYAYLHLVLPYLKEEQLPPLWVQSKEMGEEARTNFLAAFTRDDEAKLGLCVLGGAFSEGIDLPGRQLIGVIVVGVGLPTPTQRLRAIQACYARHFGDGFAYACRIPAMHKVLQAGGRVIRTETDTGLILLLDSRYYQREYETLLPMEWQLQNESIKQAVDRLEECE